MILYEKLVVDSSATLFQPSIIHATYIIHLIDKTEIEVVGVGIEEKRQELIQQCIKKEENHTTLQPCENVYIAICIDDKDKDNDDDDVSRIKRNLSIFRHAREKRYNNILLLEPGYLFNEKINEDFVRTRITDFIEEKTKNEEEFIYCLGGLSLFSVPNFWHKQRHYYSCHLTTNACIYSKEYRNTLLKMDPDTMYSWDWINSLSHGYSEPLVYTTFPFPSDKERNKERENHYGLLGLGLGSGPYVWVHALTNYVFSAIIYLLRLDISPKKGFHLMNNISKILFWCLFFSIAFTIYMIVLFYYLMRLIYYFGCNCASFFIYCMRNRDLGMGLGLGQEGGEGEGGEREEE